MGKKLEAQGHEGDKDQGEEVGQQDAREALGEGGEGG